VIFLALPLSLRADSYTTFNLLNVTFENNVAATGTLTINTTTGAVKAVDLAYETYTFTGGLLNLSSLIRTYTRFSLVMLPLTFSTLSSPRVAYKTMPEGMSAPYRITRSPNAATSRDMS
jgi:hypothetical protein